MDNLIVKQNTLVMKIVSEYVNPCDIVIDATAGNGNDTRALAKMVPEGFVYAFDIQENAIKNTRTHLNESDIHNVHLIHDSHTEMMKYIPEDDVGNISAIVFNLGYLPRGNKEITTQKENTLKALYVSLEILKKGGLIAVTVYPGHGAGEQEKEALLEQLSVIDAKKYHVASFKMINQPSTAPEVIFITKKQTNEENK